MKKLDINQFYIGTLCLSYPINHLSNKNNYSLIQQDVLERVLLLSSFDAIKISKLNTKMTDSNEQKNYYFYFITLFFKVSEEYFLCLHDDKVYSFYGKDFCKDMIPLWNFLPQMGYSRPLNLSFDKALKVFNMLFNKNFSFPYNQSLFDIKNFYIGHLHICDNLLNRYMEPILLSNYSWCCSDRDFDSETLYQCLFFDFHHNEEMYNFNDFQVYSKEAFVQDNHNFYEHLIPLKDELEQNRIFYHQPLISIPKVLRLQKKLCKMDKFHKGAYYE